MGDEGGASAPYNPSSPTPAPPWYGPIVVGTRVVWCGTLVGVPRVNAIRSGFHDSHQFPEFPSILMVPSNSRM